MAFLKVLTFLFIFLFYGEITIFSYSMPMEVSHPNYQWHYVVHDSLTGDIKDQFEHRRGDYVIGRYSLVEPDGYRRIVDYTSEPLIGFTAKVRREPINFH